MLRYLLLAFLLLPGIVSAKQEPNAEIHHELRALLQGIQKAVNEQRYSDLAPFFDKNMRVTTINQEFLSSREEIVPYFNKWFGPGGYLKKVNMKLKADALTELYANNTIGIVHGSGEEDYVLSDSRYFPMKTRWTATVIKDDDGKWRILSLHIGTNFLDNPVLNGVEGTVKYSFFAGLIIGILILSIIMLLRKRFSKAK
jgi:ketosteroid isomerase-like protein